MWSPSIVHTNLSINGKKNRYHVQNCPCGTVSANIGYELGLLMHGVLFIKYVRPFHTILFIDTLRTRYFTVYATSGGCTQYWNEIKYDVTWFAVFV